MLEKIINSKTRLSILSLLFANKDKNFYAQEIVNKTGLDPANVKKELDNLILGGFLIAKKENNKKVFVLNKEGEFFDGLKILFAKYQERTNMDKWFVIEEIPKLNPSVALSYCEYKPTKDFLKKTFGIEKFCRTVIVYEKGSSLLCHVRKEYKKMAEEVFEKLTKDYKLGIRINKVVKEMADDWQGFAKEKIVDANLGKLSDKGLLDIYSEFYKRQLASHISGWPANVVDFEGSMFSKHLMRILEKKKQEHNINLPIGEVFSVLTTPTEESLAQKEYQSLVKILGRIYAKKEAARIFQKNDSRIIEDKLKTDFIDIYNVIDKHQKEFGWLSYGFEGPGWQNIYFIDILASLVRQKASPKTILGELNIKERKTNELQKQYRGLFRLNEQEKGLFEVAKGFVFMKGYRKDRLFYGAYSSEFLFREIAKRTYLSLKQVRYFYTWEMESLLLKRRFNIDELNERFIYHVLLADREGNHIFAGENGRKFLKKLDFVKEDISNVNQLMGDTASPGKVRGIVKIVIVPEDMKKIKEGEILVSIATTPDLVPAIKKSGAIITDMGGVTCHAAIISRELGIPCVIGTKVATKVLKDGDTVEVDASHGRVTILKKK